MSDIVQRLRDSATQARALDRAALLNEAADEIERLRLTDAERGAFESMQAVCEIGVMVEKSPLMAATLRGLLERTR